MKRNGQALIETLVAVSVLVVGFLGIVALLTKSLGTNRIVTDNYTATYLAAEGIEVVKNIIDSNSLSENTPWLTGLNLTENGGEVEYDSLSMSQYRDEPLHFDPERNIYDYSGPDITSFKRRVRVQKIDEEHIRVNSIVEWITRGGGEFEVNLEDHFFNWKKYAQ